MLAFLAAQALFGLTVSAGTDAAAEKLDAELREVVANTPKDEPIPVFVWLKDVSREEIEAQALAAQNSVVEAFVAELPLGTREALPVAAQAPLAGRDTLPDIEVGQETLRAIADAYIAAERAASAKAYTEANNAWLTEAFPETKTGLFRTAEAERPEVTFVSAYSPTVSLKLTAEQIERLCENERVEMLYYEHQPEEYDPSEAEQTPVQMPDALVNALGANVGYSSEISYMTNLGKTGAGMKIGLYGYRLPKLDKTKDASWVNTDKVHYDIAFSSADIKAFSEYNMNPVVAVLIGKSEGLVPNAELYCTTTHSDNHWKERVEWLLGQNINIIMISSAAVKVYSTTSNSPESLWLDHIAIKHDAHVIVSCSGQDGKGMDVLAASPNAITVGAGIQGSAATLLNHYEANIGKPELIAPYMLALPYGRGGTTPEIDIHVDLDLATAQVTAVVTQLCQAKPTMLKLQDVMKSVLISGAETTLVSVAGREGNTMDGEIGAGMLNAKRSYYIANKNRFSSLFFAAGDSPAKTLTFMLTVSDSDDDIRISVFGLARSEFSGTNHASVVTPTYAWSSLMITVTTKNGKVLHASGALAKSTCSIRFNPKDYGGEGDYKVEITRTSAYASRTNVGVAWY